MTETPRTDAELKAADRRKRINDLAAVYAGRMCTAYTIAEVSCTWSEIVVAARALAAAVVDAEE